MSYYTDRWVLFKQEGTWGTWATNPDTFPNYLMEWSATTTENKEEEDIIAGSRDYRKRVWLEEGVVGRWVEEVVTAKIFEYVLGSHTGTAGTVTPSASTYDTGATLPSMSIYRALYPNESNATVSIGYLGMKVDTAELTVEQSGDVRLELNFAGKGVTIPASPIAKGTVSMSETAYAFHNCTVSLVHPSGTLALDNISRFVLSVNNNLEARYSAGAQTYKAIELREGALEVTGRIGLSGDITDMASIVTNRQDCTIIAKLIKTGATITFTANNVSFGEYVDELTGLDPIEVEIPFTARPNASSDALVITEANTVAYGTLVY